MVSPPHEKLSRREREIIDALFALGDRASAEEIRERLSDPPTYSAVRAMLVRLETKGYVRHREEGLRYIYMPTVARSAVRQSALRHLMETFFEGSAEKMLSTLLGHEGSKLSDEELARLAELIAKARKR